MKLREIACVAFLSVVLTGCGSTTNEPATTASSNGTSKPAKQIRVAFVTNNASDFWTIARKGVDKAAAELPNVKVEFKLPADGTAAAQKQILDDLVSQGIDGIAVSPVDPTNQTEYLSELSKKILLLTQDSDAPNSTRAAYVGTDNIEAGRVAGDEVKKALPNGGKIMVFVGKADAQNAADRYKGLQDALKGSNVSILELRTDDTDRVKAKSNVADALVKYPNIGGLVGLWSYNGPAILGAVKDANRVGQVKIVTFDEEDDTLAGVKSGAISATIVQQPFEFGYQSIRVMSDYLNGDTGDIPANKQIFVRTKIITKENVDAFTTELNKLRGRG